MAEDGAVSLESRRYRAPGGLARLRLLNRRGRPDRLKMTAAAICAGSSLNAELSPTSKGTDARAKRPHRAMDEPLLAPCTGPGGREAVVSNSEKKLGEVIRVKNSLVEGKNGSRRKSNRTPLKT